MLHSTLCFSLSFYFFCASDKAGFWYFLFAHVCGNVHPSLERATAFQPNADIRYSRKEQRMKLGSTNCTVTHHPPLHGFPLCFQTLSPLVICILLGLTNIFVCFLSCIPSFYIFPLPLSTLCSSFAPPVHLHPHPPPSHPPFPLFLTQRHTYTDNTAATCSFGNILQQESVLHCSLLTQQPVLSWPNRTESRSLNQSFYCQAFY